MYTCYIQSFKILASLHSWTGWFESYLVKTAWSTFLHDMTHPAHPCSLISISVVRFQEIWAVTWQNQQSESDQADPSLRLAYTHVVGFLMSRLIYITTLATVHKDKPLMSIRGRVACFESELITCPRVPDCIKQVFSWCGSYVIFCHYGL